MLGKDTWETLTGALRGEEHMWDTKRQVNLGCTWGERLPAFQSWELSERPTYPLSQCLGFHSHVLGLRSAGLQGTWHLPRLLRAALGVCPSPPGRPWWVSNPSPWPHRASDNGRGICWEISTLSLPLDLAGSVCKVGGCGHFVAKRNETEGQGHLRGNKVR